MATDTADPSVRFSVSTATSEAVRSSISTSSSGSTLNVVETTAGRRSKQLDKTQFVKSSVTATAENKFPFARKKVVVVGDGTVGKTSLITFFSTNEFPQEYVPTVFENVMVGMEVNGWRIDLAIWDTAGQDDYARLRPLSYPDTDALIVCFSVDQPESLKNVEEKWVPELRHFCPSLPLLLVGLKSDMRLNFATRSRCIPQEKIDEVVRQHGFAGYKECSALTGDGVSTVMEVAARLSMTPKIPGRTCRTVCSVM